MTLHSRQLSLEEMMIQDHREQEMNKPAKQQVGSADVCKFIGTDGQIMIAGKYHTKKFPQGMLCFPVGCKSGYYNTYVQTRQHGPVWVCSMDLQPMKVEPFES